MFRRGAASTSRSTPVLLVLAGVVGGLGLGAAGWSVLTREPAPPAQLPTTVVTLPPRSDLQTGAASEASLTQPTTTAPQAAPAPDPADVFSEPMVVGAQPLGPPAETVPAAEPRTPAAPPAPGVPAELSPLPARPGLQPGTQPTPQPTPQPERAPAPERTPAGAAGTRINVNTATAAELELLPNIGPALAQRIIDHRTQHGPFRTLEDLDKVRGIGPRTLEQLRELVSFE